MAMSRKLIDDADQRADGRIGFVGGDAEAKPGLSCILDAISAWI